MADFQTTAEKRAADKAFKEGKITEGTRLQSMGNGLPSAATNASSSSTPADAKRRRRPREDLRKQSACHLKNKNWKRAQERQTRSALAKNENNYKAMFRKAKALSEQGYFERAVKLLEDLKSKSPADAALAEAELVRLRAIDKERERVNNKKLKGFLNKAEKKTDDKTEEVVGQIQSATIEEVNDDGTPVASTSSA
ncbi:TPR-like protein [Mycena olivaceomarginata]|nr:TPR-like protein [Mycena olivaceomarginata]